MLLATGGGGQKPPPSELLKILISRFGKPLNKQLPRLATKLKVTAAGVTCPYRLDCGIKNCNVEDLEWCFFLDVSGVTCPYWCDFESKNVTSQM